MACCVLGSTPNAWPEGGHLTLPVILLQRRHSYPQFTEETKVLFKLVRPSDSKNSYPCCCCSVTKLCLTLCYSIACSTASFPVFHYLPEFAQIHVY